MKEVRFEDLMENVKSYISNERELLKIIKAFNVASMMHEGQKRQSGEDYIVHPLSVAFILSEMKADSDTICAGLLHDTIEDTKMTKEKIAKEFNTKIATLVDGVTKISKMNFSSKGEQIATNTRKIITSLDTDVRIVIIKLADRLHNMRTLQYKSLEKQEENSIETMEIFVPLAYYLGIYKIKSELEDLALYYLKRDEYDAIDYELKSIKFDVIDVFKKMTENIGNLLADNNISFEYKERVKSIYGLYKQTQKGKKIMDVHDLLAIKIMTDDIKDCYLALGLIHSEYPPINNKFKDYIATPKTNMYQSLHTTVFGTDDYLVQMQIRTHEMDKIDTYGLAAYWDIYNVGAYAQMEEDLKNHFQFFKSITELDAMTTNNRTFVNSVKKELFDETIHVYTTKGDIIELPSGSTPIDFAYKLSPSIGNNLSIAIVNDKEADIFRPLKNKDIVRIITDPSSHGPTLEWQEKAVTMRAKRLIKKFNETKVSKK